MGSNGKEPVCNAFGCRFWKVDHPPGTVIKHPRKESGRRKKLLEGQGDS